MLKREKLKTALSKNNGHQSTEFSTASALKIKEVATQNKAAFLSTLQSHELGLSTAEVKERFNTYGLNEVAHEKAPKWYVQFFEAFLNPFIGVLIVLAIISLITMIRTRKIPFIQSWAATPVVALTSLIMLIGIALPLSPIASAFKLVALPLSFPLVNWHFILPLPANSTSENWFINKFSLWL